MKKLQYIQPEIMVAKMLPNEAVLLLSSGTNNENFYGAPMRNGGKRAVF